MRDVCRLICLALIGLFRSRASLQAEILTLRHQLNVLRRKSPKRLTFTSIDSLVFAGLYRLAPGVLDALKIVRPETVIRWHRAGFRAYWRWKSRPRGGRPKTPPEIRDLIREISLANPLWGAPRLHGELLKLGTQSDAIAWTMLSWSASGISAICFVLTRPTTIRLGRTCRSRRMRRHRALFMPLAAFADVIPRRTSPSVCASLISDTHNGN